MSILIVDIVCDHDITETIRRYLIFRKMRKRKECAGKQNVGEKDVGVSDGAGQRSCTAASSCGDGFLYAEITRRQIFLGRKGAAHGSEGNRRMVCITFARSKIRTAEKICHF